MKNSDQKKQFGSSNRDDFGSSEDPQFGSSKHIPLRPSSRQEKDASTTDEVSLNELILKLRNWYRYLRFNWSIILIAGIFGGALGLTYAYLQTPTYNAITTFVLERADGGNSLGQYAGLASMVGVNLGGNASGIFEGDNIIELYKSRKMIEKTLLSEVKLNGESQLLIERYVDFNKLRDAWAKTPELSNIQFKSNKNQKYSRIQDSIINETVKDINKNYLNVDKLDKKLSIIKVEVKSRDELFSKAFNNLIVKNVNDFYVQTKTKKSLRNVVILQQKTDSVRAVMNRGINTTAAVADATPNLNVTRQVQRAAPMQRSQFAVETNKIILSELVKNLELSKMALLTETPLIQVLDEPVFPLEKYKFSKIKGIVLGGIIGGFLTIVFLIIRKWFTDNISKV